MPKYVIERELPGAGGLNGDDLRTISEKSNSVLAEMGGDVQSLQSYVVDDKTFWWLPGQRRPAGVTIIDPTTGGL